MTHRTLLASELSGPWRLGLSSALAESKRSLFGCGLVPRRQTSPNDEAQTWSQLEVAKRCALTPRGVWALNKLGFLEEFQKHDSLSRKALQKLLDVPSILTCPNQEPEVWYQEEDMSSCEKD